MKKLQILFAFFAVLLSPVAGNAQSRCGVIAHRGFWKSKGAAQNSIASLQAACLAGVYGSEFDVNMTADGRLIVCHGPKLNNLENVQLYNYSEIKGQKISGSERVPLLKKYLEAGRKGIRGKGRILKKDKRVVQMILEIKPHMNAALESEVVSRCVDMVKKMHMEKQVEYISFSLYVCRQLAKLSPSSSISYLGGDKAPSLLKSMGINGIDYHYSVLLAHPEWIEQAHKLGMKVNTWTVSDDSTIKKLVGMGVDYITTNEPLLAMKICK
ncbi:MAG: glycerophosphodiester phosphodiesterase [Bacteroidales bacterium]|jgi:glycerophosphoryl diester phosphodiesterase|nr:glycerophosphodiester phosphodiesterase [Bacteroidales bacterium]